MLVSDSKLSPPPPPFPLLNSPSNSSLEFLAVFILTSLFSSVFWIMNSSKKKKKKKRRRIRRHVLIVSGGFSGGKIFRSISINPLFIAYWFAAFSFDFLSRDFLLIFFSFFDVSDFLAANATARNKKIAEKQSQI